MRVLLAEEQRELERAACKEPKNTYFMERAGLAVYTYIAEHNKTEGMAVCVLCGSGGNAGDGFVTARHLRENGAKVTAVLCCGNPRTAAAQITLELAKKAGVPVIDAESCREAALEEIARAVLVVDAVFGIGFAGDLPKCVRELSTAVNASDAEVIALDVPSGVSADTGAAQRDAVRADITLCFVGMKPANVLKTAREHCGKSVLLEVGIAAKQNVGDTRGLYTLTRDIASGLLPARSALGHKGTFGRLLVCAGSERYRGAAVLAASGAYVCGAGLVTVASCEKVLDAVSASVLEAVLLDTSKNKNEAEFKSTLMAASACLIGCGLSRSKEARAMVEFAVKNCTCPLIIDADGINILADDISILKDCKCAVIMTPHLGEFARLCHLSVEEARLNRLALAREFAERHGIVLVQKSENTIIACGGKATHINTTGNSGLAKAGSGDLLAGMISSFCAQGTTAQNAALLGVWLHSRAADMCSGAINEYSMCASDVRDFVPRAIGELVGKEVL